MVKSKLLFITPHLSTGGAPQYLLKKIQELIEEFQIYCVEYNNSGGTAFVVQKNQIKELLGQKLTTLNEDKSRILEIIDIIDPDIIHFEEMPEYFCDVELTKKIYCAERRYKIIETSHDSSFNPDNKIFFPDAFAFVSEFQKKNLESLNIPSFVVEYPIEKKVRIKNREEALKALNLDPNKKHIVNVGLFTPRKNQGEIIEYARKLKNYPVQFHFVGNQADNFKDYWEPLMNNFPDNCKWWGERRDVDTFYEAADLFLFTSRGSNNDKETMPLVIREAISWNIPSLIYNLPVYLNYFDKHNNIKYLDFNNLHNNSQKIIDILNLPSDLTDEDISLSYESNENKLTIANKSSKSKECYVVIKDYLSNHTIYWFEANFGPYSSSWVIPCPKDYFSNKVANNNNFKGYKVDLINKSDHKLILSKEIIVDEYATNYEPTLAQNRFNCSYINYVEFFVKKYFDDYDIDDIATFVDVGANDGLVTEWAIKKGAERIYCLEPDKRSVKYLKEKFINDERVTIVDKALYDKNEYDVKFAINNDTSTVTALASLTSHKSIPNQDYFLSETITFRRLLSDYKIDNISLLKIDIEGAEFDLLKSLTEEEKNKVKYFLIECHFLNKNRIDTLLEVFEGNYDLEFRNHIDNNKKIELNDVYNYDMLTLFVVNKNLVKKDYKRKIIPASIHLLSCITSEREKKSIKSISTLDKYISYVQVINPPYDEDPPYESCSRPQNIAKNPGNNNLTSRHYGCYKAHTDAILSCSSTFTDYFLFFEADAVLTCDPEVFLSKAEEAYKICQKYGYNFFSFGAVNNPDKIYSDHVSSTKLIEAHAYLIPADKIKYIQDEIKYKKWDVFDLWVSHIMNKQRIGFFKEPLCLQAKGESLIDRTVSDKNYLGIEKI